MYSENMEIFFVSWFKLGVGFVCLEVRLSILVELMFFSQGMYYGIGLGA